MKPLRGFEVKFEPRDLWVGLYIAREGPELHIVVCPIPCLALHLWWVT